MADYTARFGTPSEWDAFAARHGRFLERLDRVREALNNTFIRVLEDAARNDVLLFFIGRQSVDDFFEILLMCGNAEGYAAQKLLRTMFERVVLLKYLAQHPESIDAYFSYFYITTRKHMLAVERFWGAGSVPNDRREETERRFAEVKEEFKTRKCPKCDHKEMRPAWSSVPLPDMAEEVGLGKFVPAAYYEPLQQAHPNLDGLIRRLGGDPPDGDITYRARLNRALSDEVLATAHALLLFVLEVQANHFKLPEDRYNALAEDYQYIWAKTDVEPPAPAPDSIS